MAKNKDENSNVELIEAIKDLIDELKASRQQSGVRQSFGSTPSSSSAPRQSITPRVSRGGKGGFMSGVGKSALGNIIAQTGANALPDFITKFSDKYNQVAGNTVSKVKNIVVQHKLANRPLPDEDVLKLLDIQRKAEEAVFDEGNRVERLANFQTGTKRAIRAATGIDVGQVDQRLKQSLQDLYYDGSVKLPSLEGTGLEGFTGGGGSSDMESFSKKMIWQAQQKKRQLQQNQIFHSSDD